MSFIVPIAFIPLQQKAKLTRKKKLCQKKDFCNVVMPSEDTKILELNQYQKSDKASFIVFEDPECLIENTGGCESNPENLYTTKT